MSSLFPPDDATVEAAVLSIVQARGNTASACPSEIARDLSAGNWRKLMPLVRQQAVRLAQEQRIEITQSGKVLAVFESIKGPIRLRLPRR